jgi:hypothetical protein
MRVVTVRRAAHSLAKKKHSDWAMLQHQELPCCYSNFFALLLSIHFNASGAPASFCAMSRFEACNVATLLNQFSLRHPTL